MEVHFASCNFASLVMVQITDLFRALCTNLTITQPGVNITYDPLSTNPQTLSNVEHLHHGVGKPTGAYNPDFQRLPVKRGQKQC